MWEDTFDRAAPAYDGPALRFLDEAADALTEAVAIQPHERTLDLATGTGKLAIRGADRVARGGAVVGLDISRGMLERASVNAAGMPVRFVQADAGVMPFANGRFDVALMGFGISFLPAPIATFREVRRVLRPKGRVGLSTTAHDCFAPLLDVFLDALERVGMPRPRPPRDAWRSVDRAEHLAHVLQRAGFAHRHVRRLELATWLEDPLDFWSLLTGSAWRGAIDRLEPAQREQVRSEVESGAERLRGSAGIPMRTPVLIATGVRGRLPLRSVGEHLRATFR